jgi:hypothetical protein
VKCIRLCGVGGFNNGRVPTPDLMWCDNGHSPSEDRKIISECAYVSDIRDISDWHCGYVLVNSDFSVIC